MALSLLPDGPSNAQHIIYSEITTAPFSTTSTEQDTILASDTCSCKPSLPLEIGTSSILWGLPVYFIVRPTFRYDTTKQYNYPVGFFLVPSYFLLMFTLGPVAEWTSSCEASYWHLLWIGASTNLLSALIYSGIHGKDPQDINKFRIHEYLILGVVPAVASTLIFNSLLEPKRDNGTQKTDKGALFPVAGPGYLGLQYLLRF